MLRANPFPTKTVIDGKEVPIEAGSFVTGRFAGAAECGLKPSTFWKGIVTLKRTGNIDTKSNNKWTVVIVKNWSVYQRNVAEAEDEVTTDVTPEVTAKVTAREQQSDSKVTQNKNIERRKNKPVPSADAIRLAQLLLDKIRERDPRHREPDLQRWASDIDLLIGKDGRTVEEIEKVINWCQSDTPDKHANETPRQGHRPWKGWANNILSAAKLREQFGKLLLQMQEAGPVEFRQTLPRQAALDLLATRFCTSDQLEETSDHNLVIYHGLRDALKEVRERGTARKEIRA